MTDAPASPPPMTGSARLAVPFYALGLAVLVFYVLWVSQGVLVPLVTAIFLTFLIVSVKRAIDLIPYLGPRIPNAFGFVFAFGLIVSIITVLTLIVRDNVIAVVDRAPEYQARILELAERMVVWAEGVSFIPVEAVQSLRGIIEGIGAGFTSPDAELSPVTTPADDLRRAAFSAARDFASSFTTALGGLLSGVVTTVLYTAFLLLERGRFLKKLNSMFANAGRADFTETVLDDIGRLVRSYISIKTMVSLSVALISYAIMSFLGTDFAGFWSLMIFAFGFVPIIGAVIAISLPSLLTLIQPGGGIGPAILTAVLLTGAEQTVSSFIEPRLMGHSLNLSPLVILLSLATWGTLWGFPGMLLCIPMTVTLMIVLAQFEPTRPVAIFLSDDGEVAGLGGAK